MENGEWTNMCKFTHYDYFVTEFFPCFFPGRPLCALRCRQLHKPRKNQSWKICWKMTSSSPRCDWRNSKKWPKEKVRLSWPQSSNCSTKCQNGMYKHEAPHAQEMSLHVWQTFLKVRHVPQVFHNSNLWSCGQNWKYACSFHGPVHLLVE